MTSTSQKTIAMFVASLLMCYGVFALGAVISGDLRPRVLSRVAPVVFPQAFGSQARFREAKTLLDQGDTNGAKQKLRDALALDQYNHPEYWLALASLELKDEGLDRARATVEHGLSLWHDDEIQYLIVQKRDIISQLGGSEAVYIPRTQIDEIIDMALLAAQVADLRGDAAGARAWGGKAVSWRQELER